MAPLPDTHSAQTYWADKADDWVHWADPIARLAEKLNKPLLKAIDLQSGHRLLDLASGAGEPALTAMKIAGPDGQVVATDFVPAMLSGIRDRMTDTHLQLAAADMQSLPFQDGSFDRISCRFGIMFVPDVGQVAAECLRLLRPGGVCGFMIWGPEKNQTLFRILSRAIADHFGIALDDHHKSIFRFADKGRLKQIFEEAGFDRVEEQDQHRQARAGLDRAFWTAQLEMTYGHLLAGKSGQERAQLDRHIADLFRQEGACDGNKIELESHCRILTAAKAR